MEKLFTLDDMRNAFISGGAFEKNSIEFDMDEVDEITVPDFGDYIKLEFNINVE